MARVYKPDSVHNFFKMMDDHLSGSMITHGTQAAPRTLQEEYDTALHSGKDLAVSPSVFRQRFTLEGCHILSESGVTARTSKIAPNGRYPLPCSEPHPKE